MDRLLKRAGRVWQRVRAALVLWGLCLGGLCGAFFLTPAPLAQAHEPYFAKAWGWNKFGQLGNGTSTGPEECGVERTPCDSTPTVVDEVSGVISLAAGHGHSLALLENGVVMSWGENLFGQLGDGTTTQRDLPVAVSGLSGVTAIAAGASHSLALLENGTVLAWGHNSQGELGDGTKTDSDVPTTVCAPAPEPCPGSHLSGVAAIAAGAAFSLALLENGNVVAWGENEDGQLGDATTEGSDVPVPVSGLASAIAIAAGGEHALALLAGGRVMSWGYNKTGQLGDNSEASSDVPVTVSKIGESTPPATDIAAGETHSLARLSDGTVMAWGGNGDGQLGVGSSTGPETCGLPPTSPCSKTPVAVTGLSGVASVGAGSAYSLARLGSGALFAWGVNELGQLGEGQSVGPEVCQPSPCSTKPVETKSTDAKGIGAGEAAGHALSFGPTLPVVTGISPDEPKKNGATHVTITGAEFEEALAVKFGSTEATTFTVNPSSNGTIIEAVAPAGTGTVDVTVTTPAGTSPTSGADRFYYSRPVVKRVSPRRGPELGDTTVTITGANFAGVTSVKFGSSSAAHYTVRSETEIVATSPAHTKGRVDVTVSTSNSLSAITRKDRFRYT